MTQYLSPLAFCAFSFSGLFYAEVNAEERHQYVSKVHNSAKATANSKYLVEFKEKWVYSPSAKMWTNSRGEALSADQLLKQGRISLRPVGSSGDKSSAFPSEQLVSKSASSAPVARKPVSKPSPFVYVWDETKKNKIRIMCTGFGTYHRGVKR
jgi:hypothetical protein